MLIKQLSVFLENKKGRFTEIASILGAANINMTAFTVAENSDFGILRMIVSDPEKARSVLKENRYAVNVTDVVCVECPNQPGSLAKIMSVITGADIFIEYMYAFSTGEKALVILRPNDLTKTLTVLQDNQVGLVKACDLLKH
ncbi:MAG: amino acid-binding protein [Candidatus Symbiothrix sp.]|jgi:hypothetical protein|nr:amino acid-binding protein [Candidatus Symbiothrix sp.]